MAEDELRNQLLLSLLLILCSYRAPMEIHEAMKLPEYRNASIYYICPRCNLTLDREFMHFCDRCGQCLSWKKHQKAKLIPRKNRLEK